jgi:predicted RNA-binding Zn-ribbon protein involved in translation (DUF1610 family)
MATAQHPDDCPRCGERVEVNLSYGIGARNEGEELPQPTEQSTTCPNCGAKLRRAVGYPWSEAAS